MSGKVVPASGDIRLKTAPASASNAIFEVFGTPAGGNLVGLVGSNVDPGTRPPPFTVAATVPTAASGNLKMSFFAGKAAFLTSPNVPAISTLTTTAVTPTLAGGSGTSYYIAIGTSAGASNTVAWRLATTATSITGLTFALNTSYFISVYGSNATNASSLAVSNASSFIIPNAPTFGATYGISNTTFTAVAASTTAGAVISYTISPSSGVTQASTGVFTGLAQNTQYTVTAIARMSNAGAGYSSNSTAGTTVYCLSPPTFSGFSIDLIRSTIAIDVSTSGNSTGAIISNIGGSSTTRTSRITSYSWERSSSTTGSTFLSNTFVSYSVAVTAPNSIYYASNIVNFAVLNAGGTLAVTLPAATFSYQLVGGTGGTGVNASGVFGSAGGYGSYITGTSALSAGAALLLYAGRNGISGSGTSNTAAVNSGDGTKGGNGGYGAGTTAYSTANGGSSGGGGSASQIMCVASNYIVIAGGGGGGGGGGAQGGQGGAGGATFITASTGAIGGQGNSYSNNLYDAGNGGGYYGGYGGSGPTASGGTSGSALAGNYAVGEAGGGSGFPVSIINSTWGKGGNGSFFYGSMGAGGGGGWGGGGAGVARNYAGSIDSGGGGGGGSHASDASGTFSTTYNPYIAILCYS